MNWFDEKGYMVPLGENGVLFTSYYLHKYSWYTKTTAYNMDLAITAALVDYNDHLSHDNWTGIVCASKLLGFSYHQNLFSRSWWRRIHPRDIGFYLYMKFGFKPLLIPTVIAMIWACWSNQQTNGTLDTDGKLLSWLRLKHMNMPWLERLLGKILRKRHGLGWDGIFKIYFKDPEHPLVKE